MVIGHGTPGAVVGVGLGVVVEVEGDVEDGVDEVAGGGVVLLDVAAGGVVVVGSAGPLDSALPDPALADPPLLAAARCRAATLSSVPDEQAASTAAVASPHTAARIFFTTDSPVPVPVFAD